MLCKGVIFLLTLCTMKIVSQKVPKYRFDYTFSEQADGWLKFHRVPATWSDAMLRCHAEGAVLASPLTVQLQKAILKYVSNESTVAIFTGVNSLYSEGDFTTVEGISLLRLPITWAVGEPNGVDNSEGCLAMKMKSSGAMADVRCNDALPYVCYKRQTEIALTECGTSDKEYELDSHTGSCYKFHNQGREWSKAYMTCIAEGGHLAVINSEDEATALRNLYGKFNDENILSETYPGLSHIGFRNMIDGGTWKTIHGETLVQAGFNGWDAGQPDNNTNKHPVGENCGTISRSGLLHDMWCGWPLAFICEKKPDSLL